MRKAAGFFCLIISSLSADAQHSTVAPMVGNVLAKGIPNWVKVGLPGIAADSIIVAALHSKVEKIDNWNWYITPDTGFSSETIIVTALKKKKVVSTDSTVFRLKWVADPHAYASGCTGSRDTVLKSLLVGTLGIAVHGWNEDTDFPYVVQSFTMGVEPYAPAYHANDPYLTDKMRAAIQSAKSGDRVVFYNILVKYPDGRIKYVENISVILK